MGSSSHSHSVRTSAKTDMDYSVKDHLGGSLQDHYPSNSSSRRNPAMDDIISPKRGLGKKAAVDNVADGIFRKPSTGGFKLPFLSGKTV